MDNTDTNTLKISDFDYDLPPELIAQTPIEPRDASRLLVVHRASGMLEHRHFYEIGAYLRPGDLLIANQSRVLPARLLGRRAETGGAVEVLLLAERPDLGPDHWETLVHPGRRLREGARIVFGDGDDASLHAEILQRTEAGGRIVRFFVDPTPPAPGHYLPPRQGPSLPDCFGVVPHLAPTRAHPPPTQPRATTFRMTAPPPDDVVVGRRSGRGGQATCSGTGWLGGCGGPLWVPGGGTNRNVSGRERQGPCPPDRVPQGIAPTIHDRAVPSPQASTGIRQLIEQLGHMPLPPYIHEPLADPERYQTVYARIDGSAAAPTAGLHFTPQLLEQLRRQGVRVGFVTLHVGLDTFKPVECEDVGEHKMHSEAIDLDAPTAELINETRRAGGRIMAVGTTSVRVLESAATVAGFHEGESSQLRIDPYCGHTRLFITPGYRFRVVDALITNFHLPRSTLLLLVSAFAGKALIEKAYQEAIRERYRFFSFGDAMLLL